MKRKDYFKSFNNAVNGIVFVLKHEKNMKFHFLAASLVLILALFYSFTRLEMIHLLTAITFVIIAEMFNTAGEKIIDMISIEYHPMARIVKDILAGGVLISAVYATVVGYLLFFDKLIPSSALVIDRLKNSPMHLTLISFIIVVLLIIVFKAKYSKGRGTYFQGGAISGHSAIAFLAATIVFFQTDNILNIVAAYFLATLVAQSRVEGGIHTPSDVLIGSILGLFSGFFFFKIIGNL